MEEKWELPQKKSVKTIYFQGMLSSQTQLAKYTGNKGFVATTGEHVVCKGGIELIYEPFLGEEIDEVQLFSPTQSYSLFQKMQQWISFKANQSYGIEVKPRLDAQNTTTVSQHSLDITKVNIGQVNDTLAHKNRYTMFENQFPDEDCILFGVSRGAATTFSSFCMFPYKNVKMVILEGAFSSLDDVLEKRHGFLSGISRYAISWLPSFETTFEYPIHRVKLFPETVPVVFITSKIDKEVPMASTEALAKALALQNKNTVYLIILECSSHPRYPLDNSKDKDTYAISLHSIYKRHGLPYIPSLASLDEKQLDSLIVNCS